MKSDKHNSRITQNSGNAGMALTLDMSSAKRRQRGNGGFTLAETLLAVLILLLVSTIVATGMPAAVNAYNKVVVGASAKVMLSTAITALHDEIGTAWKVKETASGSTTLTFFNASTGAESEISLDSADHNAIQIKDYQSLSDDMIHDAGYTPGQARHLVDDLKSAENARMYVTYTGISYTETTGVVTITGLKVCKADGTVLVIFAKEDGTPLDFKIRVISKDIVKTSST